MYDTFLMIYLTTLLLLSSFFGASKDLIRD